MQRAGVPRGGARTDAKTTVNPIRVANAPCSWGVLEFDLQGQAAGPDRVMDEMSAAGYAGTELGDWGFLPTGVTELKKTLRRLELVGAFVPVALTKREAHDDGEARAVRTARLLARVSERPFLVLADDNGSVTRRVHLAGRVRPEHGLTKEQWSVFAEGANRIAEAVLREAGVSTVFHHHCAGWVETPQEIDTLLSLTDPALLGLCLDTGHYAFGGGDPLDCLRRYRKRIWHVHFKDHDPRVHERCRQEGLDYFAAVKAGIFCGLGQGDVPFPAIVQELRATKYEGWIVVEQDVLPGMGTPLQSAVRSRQYLRGLGL